MAASEIGAGPRMTAGEKRYHNFIKDGVETLQTTFECPNYIKRNEREAVEEGLKKGDCFESFHFVILL